MRRKFLRDGEAGGVLEGRTKWVDSVVGSASKELLEPAFPQGLALLAVGGYGRRELYPASDVDLLLLTGAGQPAGAARAALSRFLQALWDAGLRLSHSLRTLRECCEVHGDNVEFNISLLDRRYLAGDAALWTELDARMPKFLHGQRQDLARYLSRLSRERHAKFHNTIYHLEPNIKETPGGLRDLHMLDWFSRLEAAAADRGAELESARRFLASLRCFLHFRSGRDSNLFDFEAQEEFATAAFTLFEDPSRAMGEYYRHVRVIRRTALREMEAIEGRHNSLLSGFRDWRARLSNAEFTVARERVLFKAPQHLEKDPELALRLFQFVARHRVGLHSESERKLAEQAPQLGARLRAAGALWPKLRELLAQPHASFALRAMHETGLLRSLLPAWGPVECLVIRDFNHRYTVDEHTLIVIENLEMLGAGEAPDLVPFAGLLGEIEDTPVVKMAMLLHDAGKAAAGAVDHCSESGRLAAEAAGLVGMPEGECRLLRFLIENHLLLSLAMAGRDLADPETAAWLAHQVETIEKLKMLTLFTVCDIGGVHPGALTPWRREQLWRAYLVVHAELTRELESERIQGPGEGSAERQAFLKGFPTRYLLVHEEGEISHHMELDAARREAGVAVEIRREKGVYRLTVVAKDRLFLFASLAGALAGFGMNILKAEAFSNQQGTVLDTFTFEDPQRTLELNPSETDRLRQTLERVVLGRVDVKSLLKNRPRPSPPSKRARISPRVQFDSGASNTATLVEVVAEDRPGLLHALASALSEAGCNIEVVLVDTEAHKALDVFYVTATGRKLNADEERKLQAALVAACAE